MSNFEQYVAGRTVAIVGPAPVIGDQRAEIEAHDIVYHVASYAPNNLYTDRVDVAFLNGQVGREILDTKWDACRSVIDRADWWVYKNKNSRAYRPHGNQRHAHLADNVKNCNAITAMLWDLTYFHPESITVFGTDLYAAGPGKVYAAEYKKSGVGYQARGIVMHKPIEQFRAHRAVHRTGKVVGDARYLAAVTMTEEQYGAVITQWQTAYETAKQADPALT